MFNRLYETVEKQHERTQLSVHALTREWRGCPIGNPRNRAPITRQIGAQRTNLNLQFCYRYDLY